MQLYHVIGDATQPVKKPALIAHVCNNVDAWGAGFVIALGKAYPGVESDFHRIHPSDRKLGFTQFSVVDGDIIVANMIAQHGLHASRGTPPIRYNALHTCLTEVQSLAEKKGLTVHAPRIGAKLAGGDWSVIKSIIMATMKVDTYIYTLPSEVEAWPETRKDAST